MHSVPRSSVVVIGDDVTEETKRCDLSQECSSGGRALGGAVKLVLLSPRGRTSQGGSEVPRKSSRNTASNAKPGNFKNRCENDTR